MLYIDFETTSEVNIKDVGSHAYASHPSTKIVCMAYAFDDGEVKLWLPDSGYPALPYDVYSYMAGGGLISAWNVSFERSVIECNHKYFPTLISPDQYRCTMARAARVGLPSSLKEAAKVIGTELKDESGARSMRVVADYKKFIKLDTKKKSELLRITYKYCKQDVVAERNICNNIPYMTETELELWKLDQKINFRGLPIDTDLCRAVVSSLSEYMEEAIRQVPIITGGEVERPTQVQRILKFCRGHGVELENLQSDTLSKILDTDLPNTVREILEIRQKTSLASTAKFQKMLNMAPTGKAYGTLKYYGASTGRWSGRGLQPQNLPRPDSKYDVDDLVSSFKRGESDSLDDVYTAAKSCLRSAICAPDGYTFVVLDYSGIEARVLAWLAGDRVTCQKLSDGVDLYKDMAADIYNKDIDLVTPEERHVGKAAILGLGYQMGAKKFHGELQKIDKGYTFRQAETVVKKYRGKYKKNVRYWYYLQESAESVSGMWDIQGPWKRFKLSSGRHIYYYGLTKYDTGLSYMKTIPSRGGKMFPTSIYAGKFAENVTQATARDVLASAMMRIDMAGYKIVSTVHDEIVVMSKNEDARETFNTVERLMTDSIPWANGLPLTVTGYISQRFKK